MENKTAEQIDMEEAQLKKEGATYHKWKDMVDIIGTGKFVHMPEGKEYREHKLTANVLIKKGYATKA